MKGDQQIKKTKTVTVKVSCEQKSCKNCTRIARCQARREAEKLLAEFVLEIEKGLFLESSKLTFSNFVDRWIKDYAESNLAPKTLSSYQDMLRKFILPAFGHLKLEQIKPAHLIEFYANLQEDGIRLDGKQGGLSEKTISYTHRIISSVLQDAVQWQVIASNPASRVKPPKVTKKQTACYDEEQTAALMEAIENEGLKYKVIILLAVFTGLRRGELMGLEWQDIDFNKGTLLVRQASQYLPDKGTFTKAPKNESSVRLMALPASIMTLLKQYKVNQAEERLKVGDLWRGTGVLSNFTELLDSVTSKDVSAAQLLKILRSQDGIIEKWEDNLQAIAVRINNEEIIQELCKFGEKAAPEIAALNTLSDMQLKEFISLWKSKKSSGGRLFVTWDGQPMHPDTISKWFPKFLKRHELPPLPFHGLRHTAATMLINQGLPAKSISGRMGHADIGTTYNIYGHYLKSADKEAADRLEKVYQNMKGNVN
ncbi:site-specific integrase [Pelotomaculum sp. FP]|nr:site-specific integrase [Pelotomaculum sp. FP]